MSIFITGPWLSIFVLLVGWQFLKTVEHHCPECHEVIGTASRIKIRPIGDIFTIQFGSCAVVLHKRWVYCFMTILVLLFGFSTYRSVGNAQAFFWVDF